MATHTKGQLVRCQVTDEARRKNCSAKINFKCWKNVFVVVVFEGVFYQSGPAPTAVHEGNSERVCETYMFYEQMIELTLEWIIL